MNETRSRWTRVQVWLVSAVALVLWTAESCQSLPVVRILTPKAGLDATYEPLLIEIDHWGFADHGTLEVLLNGVDITSEFDFEPDANFRRRGTAIDVWGAGIVNAGSNTLVVTIESWQATRVFDTTGDPYADDVASFGAGTGAGFGQGDLPGVVTGAPAGLGLFLGGLDVLSLGAGGVVELEFVDNVVLDGPGVDFTVFENPFMTTVLGFVGDPFAEPGRVSVSQDGTTWHVFTACETAPLDPPLPSVHVHGDNLAALVRRDQARGAADRSLEGPIHAAGHVLEPLEALLHEQEGGRIARVRSRLRSRLDRRGNAAIVHSGDRRRQPRQRHLDRREPHVRPAASQDPARRDEASNDADAVAGPRRHLRLGRQHLAREIVAAGADEQLHEGVDREAGSAGQPLHALAQVRVVAHDLEAHALAEHAPGDEGEQARGEASARGDAGLGHAPSDRICARASLCGPHGAGVPGTLDDRKGAGHRLQSLLRMNRTSFSEPMR